MACTAGAQRENPGFGHGTPTATAPYRTSQDVVRAFAAGTRGKEFKYHAQVFQALRIEVNKELEALESFLLQCSEVIVWNGRLVIMSYHRWKTEW